MINLSDNLKYLKNFTTNECKSFYLYSENFIIENCKKYKISAQENGINNAMFCYAVKANLNKEIIKIISNQGFGVDVTSIGELKRALEVNVNPNLIVYSGICKTKIDIEFALKNKIFQINIESINELLTIQEVAKNLGKIANIAIRINPNIDAETHNKISTGREGDKFGIEIEDLEKILKLIKKSPNVNLQGLSMHIGSQITKLENFSKAFDKLNEVYNYCIKEDFDLRTLDIGGGIGVKYKSDDEIFELNDYMKLINEKLPKNLIKIFEPGRFIVANAGFLIAQVIYIKESKGKKFAILNAGMNNLMRPALYDAYHEIEPMEIRENESFDIYDFVGPICETSDVFAKNKKFQKLKEGDWVKICSAGAYGYSMANFYNGRPLLEERIIRENGQTETIRDKIDLI